MEFIDTHTHISDDAFRGEEDGVIARAVAAGVSHMIQPDIDSSERDAMFALCERHPGVLHPMLGLYPGSVHEGWEKEIGRLEPYRDMGVVAVGEIGLDYHEGKEFAREQKEVLRLQFELAAKLDLPVNIHLRDAWEDFFAVLEDCRHLHLRGNLHCFSGSFEVYGRANRSGDFAVGIGGVLTFKNASLPAVVARIPLEHLLLETDAPYLAPVPYRGKRNESAYLPLIAARLAEVKGLSLNEIETITTDNAIRLFNL
jgi:TatD DNase family protein